MARGKGAFICPVIGLGLDANGTLTCDHDTLLQVLNLALAKFWVLQREVYQRLGWEEEVSLARHGRAKPAGPVPAPALRPLGAARLCLDTHFFDTLVNMAACEEGAWFNPSTHVSYYFDTQKARSVAVNLVWPVSNKASRAASRPPPPPQPTFDVGDDCLRDPLVESTHFFDYDEVMLVVHCAGHYMMVLLEPALRSVLFVDSLGSTGSTINHHAVAMVSAQRGVAELLTLMFSLFLTPVHESAACVLYAQVLLRFYHLDRLQYDPGCVQRGVLHQGFAAEFQRWRVRHAYGRGGTVSEGRVPQSDGSQCGIFTCMVCVALFCCLCRCMAGCSKIADLNWFTQRSTRCATFLASASTPSIRLTVPLGIGGGCVCPSLATSSEQLLAGVPVSNRHALPRRVGHRRRRTRPRTATAEPLATARLLK